MGRVLIVVLGVVLLVYAFFDLIGTPSSRVRFLPKFLWLVVILLPYVGPLLWLFFHQGVPPFLRGPGGQPRPPQGPDDDPEFLRGL